MYKTLPCWHGSDLGTISVDFIPLVFTAASINVDLVDGNPALTLPEVTSDPEDNDDGESEEGLEETSCIIVATRDGADSNI
jgi:hypothetical protein